MNRDEKPEPMRLRVDMSLTFWRPNHKDRESRPRFSARAMLYAVISAEQSRGTRAGVLPAGRPDSALLSLRFNRSRITLTINDRADGDKSKDGKARKHFLRGGFVS